MKRLSAALITALIITFTGFALPAHANDPFTAGINQARVEQGKPRLEQNADLQRVAQDKAQRMANANALTADGYSAAWKGGSQAIAADPAGRAEVLVRNEFLGKQAGTTLNGSYGAIGVGSAVSANGTLFVAVNVAPKPYTPVNNPVPPADNGGAGSSGAGNASGGANAGSDGVDTAAAVAAAEKAAQERLEAQLAEEKKKAEADRKAQEEVQAREAEKKAKEEAEAREAEKKAQEEREADAAAKIQEAEDRAEAEAAAKQKAEEDRLATEEENQRRMAVIILIMKIAAGVSAAVAGGSGILILMSRQKPVQTQAEFLGLTGPAMPLEDDDDDDFNFMAARQKKSQLPTAPLPTLSSAHTDKSGNEKDEKK